LIGHLGDRERIDRKRARAWALQVHYGWESSGREGTLTAALTKLLGTRRVSPRRLPYVKLLLGLVDEHLPEIDRRLHAALENWRLERLSAIDRAILRVACAELFYLDDVPPKVTIQEGIRLAEQYGGPESPRFVNGVLDALYKRGIEPETERGEGRGQERGHESGRRV
jgi:N utilization substance protein B